jgi:hypothetical protein
MFCLSHQFHILGESLYTILPLFAFFEFVARCREYVRNTPRRDNIRICNFCIRFIPPPRQGAPARFGLLLLRQGLKVFSCE